MKIKKIQIWKIVVLTMILALLIIFSVKMPEFYYGITWEETNTLIEYTEEKPSNSEDYKVASILKNKRKALYIQIGVMFTIWVLVAAACLTPNTIVKEVDNI